MLYGSHTGISSLAILVAAVFWAALWGPIGLILSTPLTVCLILMGRYVPQLNFLEVILGDEPVLAVEAHFYQRLLALDQDEATEIAENFLKEKPLGNLYDQVVIPALAMAEQDRHLNVLDSGTADFVSQTTRELIDEVGERFFDAVRKDQLKEEEESQDRQPDSAAAPVVNESLPKIFSSENDSSEQESSAASWAAKGETTQNDNANKKDNKKDDKEDAEVQEYAKLSGLRVVCIAARDEADELVGQMLAQWVKKKSATITFPCN